MKRNIFLTLIIPVYNTPINYLERCLYSIFSSYDKTDIEVIISDDGSREEIRDFLYTIQNDTVRIILNNHAGVSNTRNIGIEAAKGEYVAFIDADDFVLPCFVENSCRIAKKYSDADIIIGGLEYRPYRKVNDLQFGNQIDVFEGDKVFNIRKSMMHIDGTGVDYYVLGTPCGRLYKTSLARKALFPKNVALCEDQIFNHRALIQAQKVVVVPEFWYVYEQNENSVMYTKVKKDYWGMVKPYWDELYALDLNDDSTNKDGMRGFYVRSFYNMIGQYTFSNQYTKVKLYEVLDMALSHPLMQLSVDELSLSADIPIDRKIEWALMRIKAKKLIFILSKILIKNSYKEIKP